MSKKKQMMEIHTSKTVDNALGDYISRTYNGQAWTRAEYDWQNSKGEFGSQYGVRDWSRANLNFEVVLKHGRPIVQPIDHSKPSLQDRWQQRIDQGYKAVVRTKKGDVRKPIKKSEVKIVMMELGGNRDRMHELAYDGKVRLGKLGIGFNASVSRRNDIEKWALDCWYHLARKYGAANIIDFVAHLDETNPHIHVTLVPLTADGKLSYTDLFGGSHAQAAALAAADGTKPNFRKAMSEHTRQLHTDFYEEVGRKWGLDRGDDIRITGATHLSTEESIRVHNTLEAANDELVQANETADANLSIKNKAMAKIGLKPVRKKSELEEENEKLTKEKEAAEASAAEAKEKANTAYSEGMLAGVNKANAAAKKKARQEIPEEICDIAGFKPQGEVGVESIARNWKLQYNLRVKAEKKADTAEKEAGRARVTLKTIINALYDIPLIKAAIDVIFRFFRQPQLISMGFNEGHVATVNNALNLVNTVNDRRQLGKVIVEAASEGLNPSEYNRGKIDQEVELVATYQHRYQSDREMDNSLKLNP